MGVRWSFGPLVVTGLLRPRAGLQTLREWWIEPPHALGTGVAATPLGLEGMTRRHGIDSRTRQPQLHFWNADGLEFELVLLRDMRYAALVRLTEPRPA